MGVFDNCSVLLELKHLPFKEKQRLKSLLTENGGNISFTVNKQCSLVVTSDLSNLSSNRLRSIQKNRTPVVGLDYLPHCVEKGLLLPVDEYKMDTSTADPPPVDSASRAPISNKADPPTDLSSQEKPAVTKEKDRFKVYTQADSALPAFPDEFQVAKYSVFGQENGSRWFLVELQSARAEQGRRYRVARYWRDDVTAKAAVVDRLVFSSTSEEAQDAYKAFTEELERSDLQRLSSIPPEAPQLGSAPLQQLLLEERLNSAALSHEVALFVELLWTEALGCLELILRVPVSQLSLNDVSRAEGLLLQAQKKLKEGDESEVSSLVEDVFNLLPHIEPKPLPVTAKFLSQKLDLCQLIRDVLNVSEMTMSSPKLSSMGKYRALRCSIEAVPTGSNVFQKVAALLAERPIQIQQIMRVSRGVELQTFRSDLWNVKPLLHSSSPSNFVGILSRGLLLPRVGVADHGIKRTDIGNLGCGIYFSDSLSTSLKYSKPGETDGSRLLLICDVALGSCKDFNIRDTTLTEAPNGYQSVHGVRATLTTTSEFEDDEYVVYSADQVQMKYVVQFRKEEDQLKSFSPDIDLTAEPSHSPDIFLKEDLDNIKDPLEEVTAGLLDNSGNQLPLEAVHVKCKLIDLLSQVVIFQKYTNHSSVPIEAKYVFPLDDSAAVCGFEAFINGKHVVGEVKEKETARQEYRQAISRGHGAYLMDQDAPDVFTISVGNLPPGAAVLIKVTFLSELVVRDGAVFFSLPGSVAPWQESAALHQTTQFSVRKVCVTDEVGREFSLDMSVEMPNKISSLKCINHQAKIKMTDTKAVVSVLPGQVLGPDGFHLVISLSEVHLPRMWVEKHPDKDSQACMLVFYPEFELDSSSGAEEVILLLDTSESMGGNSVNQAKNIALNVLKNLESHIRINIVLFGIDHTEAFLTAQKLEKVRKDAMEFIKKSSSAGGSTELWRPLRTLSLLPPSSGVRNLLLLSDGHIQNAAITLQLVRDNARHTRLFTCGLSSTANRHMLRALAQAGGGAYEFFDAKTKHTWAEKVERQVKRMSSPGCSSASVMWQRLNPTAPSPLQAPNQLHALFNDCHTLVYGFVPNCTQATLLGDLQGKAIQTMVSTTELQKSTGTFLHKLTARAIIRDFEDGSLDTTEAEHEVKKAELKSFIIDLSKEFSVLSQFTSFVAIEERNSKKEEDGITDIPKLIAAEDVDFLPYISWTVPEEIQTTKEHMDCTVGETFANTFPMVCGSSIKYSHSSSQESDDDDLMDWCVAADEPATFEALQPEEEYSVGFYSNLSSHTIPKTARVRSAKTTGFSFASPYIETGGGIFSAIKKKVLMTDMKHQMDQTTDVVNYGSTLEFGVAPCGFPFQFGKEDRGTEVLLCESESLAIPIRYRSAAFFSSSTSIHPPVFRDDILPPPPELGATLPPPPPVFAVAKPAPHVLERGWSSLTTSMHSRTQQTPIGCFGSRDVLHAQLLKHSGTVSMKPDAEQLRLKWNKIHQLQQAEGYWDLTVELGELINLNVDVFNVFLKNKGVHSLGVKAHADILRLVATLLVLQLMRVEKVEEGELLQSLFQLKEPTESRSEHKEQIKKAVDWVRWADREYPCTCSRLEFGWNWESSTLQLLGFEPFPLFSPLVSLNLRNTAI